MREEKGCKVVDTLTAKHSLYLSFDQVTQCIIFPLSRLLSLRTTDPLDAGHSNVVAFLLERFKSEIDINRRNIFGFTAVMKAALQGRIKCLRSLLSAGQQTLLYPLSSADNIFCTNIPLP